MLPLFYCGIVPEGRELLSQLGLPQWYAATYNGQACIQDPFGEGGRGSTNLNYPSFTLCNKQRNKEAIFMCYNIIVID